MLALIMIWVGAVAAVLLLALGVLLAVVGVRRFRRRRAEAVQAPDAAEPKASVAPAPGFPEYDPANPHYRDGHQWIDDQWRQVQVWDDASQQWYLHGVDANGAPTARAVGVPRKPQRRPSPRGAIAMATVGALLAVGAVPLGIGTGSALLSSVAAVGGLPTEIVQESAQYRFTQPTVIDHDEVLHYQFRVSDDEFSEQAYEDYKRNNGMVAAFFDSQLTLLADYEAHVNFVDNSLTLTPERRSTDSVDDSSFFASAGASWSPMSELYLVQYIDRDGNAYDKPIVTRAQIRKAAKAPDAPTVAVATAPDGYLDMTWEAVPDAANYAVFSTAQTDYGNNTYTLIGMTEGGETSWSSRGAVPEDCYFSHGGDDVQNCALQPSWVSRTNGSQTGYGVVAMGADGTPSFMQRIDGTGIDSSLPGEVGIERPVGTTTWYSGQPDSFPLRARAGTVSGDLVEVPLVFDHAEVTADGQTGWIYAKATGTAATVRLGWDGIDGTWDGFVAEVKNRLDSASSDLTGIAEPSFLEVAEPLSEDIPISTTAPQTDLPVPDEFGEIGEYVAANLIAGNQRIDMDAVANPFSSRELVDAVISQTPYAYVAQYTFRSDGTGREILEVSYEMGVDEMRDLQKRTHDKVREVVGQVVTEGMSDRDKALALNNWIIENAEYDTVAFDAMTADRSTARDPQYAHAWRPDGILLQGTAVCGGYAEAFQVLSEEAGLDTVYVSGTVDTSRHAWNKTFWDGQWWVIDTTWNDTAPQNELFAISDEVALNDWKHAIENMYWTVPTMVAQYATN